MEALLICHYKNMSDIPGGPVVKTLYFKHGGVLDPRWGNKISHATRYG